MATVALLPSTLNQTVDLRCTQDTATVAHSGALYLVEISETHKAVLCDNHLSDLGTQITTQRALSSPSTSDLAQDSGPDLSDVTNA